MSGHGHERHVCGFVVGRFYNDLRSDRGAFIYDDTVSLELLESDDRNWGTFRKYDPLKRRTATVRMLLSIVVCYEISTREELVDRLRTEIDRLVEDRPDSDIRAKGLEQIDWLLEQLVGDSG